jgi:hypothetical protein
MPTREELIASLDEAISLLRDAGRPAQAASLERDLEYIARGDDSGLEELLSSLREWEHVPGEEASPVTQALAHARRVALDLRASGEQRARPVEFSNATLGAGFLVFAILGAGAWLGSYPVGLLVGLYYQTGPRLKAAADALTSGLVTLVWVYALVFLGCLVSNKGNRGIPIGIIAGVVGCLLIWIVRWPK